MSTTQGDSFTRAIAEAPKKYLCSTCGYRTSLWLNLMAHVGAVHNRNLLPEESAERPEKDS